ncbi:MAG: GGDEF domain-containing protein [Alphaproteobacteria bacterium]
MKIDDSNRVKGPGGVLRRGDKNVQAAGKVQPRVVTDASTILSIPEHELTPKVRTAILRLMEEVDHLRRELEQSRARIAYLENLADQDTLLPVANRRAFVRELTRMMAFAERYRAPASLLYFDINAMKDVNDTHGHGGGDAALKHVADVLLKNTRSSDVVGRLGGDEFAVILANADQATANEKATLLAAAIENAPFEWHGKQIGLTVSVGAYTFRGGENAGEALDAADRAMYERKQLKGETR